MGDTTLPETRPTYGSSFTLPGGSAVLLAAQDVRGKLARLCNLPPERAAMAKGRIGPADKEAGLPIADTMVRAGMAELVGRMAGRPRPGCRSRVTAARGRMPCGSSTPFSWRWRSIRRSACSAYSAGRIINPRTACAQMTGGIIWRWGMAAMDARNLSNVALPVNADIPGDRIEVMFVDEFDAHARPIGAKGIGK